MKLKIFRKKQKISKRPVQFRPIKTEEPGEFMCPNCGHKMFAHWENCINCHVPLLWNKKEEK